eukprot:Protomagalhaensia_sp_Gyna_25__5322@NODE_66_length_5710_cov_131_847117_g49_i0_p4_GENE_NODE_66_length_5710_cov_131_847117_g49_i0NODE_66_length_5710_cov_131_847117_g49_i0_p4_ORF_typecomplete_len273_score31_66Wtap/PF17098_5/1_2e15Wtap/PF17098_5/32MAD/PF05557_13/0_073MAD/PF05557_13/0_82CHASE3/PF05227_13/0_04CHASE3/PF05227_13/9_4e02Herpes_BLRF2/PF05812_12/17Herpes_BLRF2/PF05812_12/49Herpes_BLRF2/PF05812_12/3_2TMF_DNA_bd/PF12329_8/16TMF_DNA_bd/PF12329_8/4_8e03TMF_DNA_bd/PF12329_8/0_24TTKRSYEDQ/PF10212_
MFGRKPEWPASPSGFLEEGWQPPVETEPAKEEAASPALEHSSPQHLQCHVRLALLEAENRKLKSDRLGSLLATTDLNQPGESSGGDAVLVDPAVALEITQLRSRLQSAESELKTLKENYSIMSSFTSEGPLGKRLLERCRKLLRENEQLGECLIASKVAKKEQHEIFTEEKVKFLMSQLRLLFELNTDLEGECSALSKAVNRLAVMNNALRADIERTESHSADLQRRLERADRDRSLTTAPRAPTERSRHRHSPPRRRSPSYEKADRGRRGR